MWCLAAHEGPRHAPDQTSVSEEAAADWGKPSGYRPNRYRWFGPLWHRSPGMSWNRHREGRSQRSLADSTSRQTRRESDPPDQRRPGVAIPPPDLLRSFVPPPARPGCSVRASWPLPQSRPSTPQAMNPHRWLTRRRSAKKGLEEKGSVENRDFVSL